MEELENKQYVCLGCGKSVSDLDKKDYCFECERQRWLEIIIEEEFASLKEFLQEEFRQLKEVMK